MKSKNKKENANKLKMSCTLFFSGMRTSSAGIRRYGLQRAFLRSKSFKQHNKRLHQSRALSSSAASTSGEKKAWALESSFDANCTPMLEELRKHIELMGPVTCAEYMSMVLTHPEHGYYRKSEIESIGSSGDFVTSPEISQAFGEMVGIWCVAMWQSVFASAPNVRVIELGPGRGTLMKDMLRACSSFGGFVDAVSSVNLVETSLSNSKHQKDALLSSYENLNFSWHESFDDIDWTEDMPTFVIAHEFFDALPVHLYSLGDKGWREVMVDVEKEDKLCFGLSNRPTAAAKAFFKEAAESDEAESKARSELGKVVEVSPTSCSLVDDICEKLEKGGGASLIIDYGDIEGSKAQTLRGVQRHQFVHPLKDPGMVDLTADVDFAALKRAALETENKKVSVHGPVSQAHFLSKLGIEHRVSNLIDEAETDEDAQLVYDGFVRIMDTQSEGMGQLYKAMSIVSPLPGQNIDDDDLPGF